jgi:hypothetical protein
MYPQHNPNYKEMFNDTLYDMAEKLNIDIWDKIRWLRELLHNNSDRITWYLRLFRIGIVTSYISRLAGAPRGIVDVRDLAEQKALAEKLYYRLTSSYGGGNRSVIRASKVWVQSPNEMMLWQSVNMDMQTLLWNIDEGLNHFMRLNIPALDDVVFGWKVPSVLRNELEAIEEEYTKHLGPGVLRAPREDYEVVLDFGDGYVWFDTEQRSVSDQNTSETGHCSTCSRYNEEALVLRERSVVDGVTYWRQVLQFCLDRENGMLGEMKGRANSKPKADYYKYIIPLLFDVPEVKGIIGGGHKPWTNFSVLDLPEEYQDRAGREKPELFTLNEYVSKYGVDDYVRSQLDFKQPFWERPLTTGRRVEYEPYLVLAEGTLTALAEEYNSDDGVKWVVAQINDNEPWDIPKEGVEYAAKLIPHEWQAVVDGDLDWPRDWVEDDELSEMVWRATSDAYASGTFKNMYDAFVTAMCDLDSCEVEVGSSEGVDDATVYCELTPSIQQDFDTVYRVVCPVKDLIEALEDGYDFGDGNLDAVLETLHIPLERPYYGWDEMDEPYFLERMKEFLLDAGYDVE